MEGFQLLSTGAWSILPPLLALGLALITKEVYSSLLVGVFSGLIIYEFCLEGVGFDQLITAFTLSSLRLWRSKSHRTRRLSCSWRYWVH